MPDVTLPDKLGEGAALSQTARAGVLDDVGFRALRSSLSAGFVAKARPNAPNVTIVTIRETFSAAKRFPLTGRLARDTKRHYP
jgi:hypothetical protein